MRSHTILIRHLW